MELELRPIWTPWDGVARRFCACLRLENKNIKRSVSNLSSKRQVGLNDASAFGRLFLFCIFDSGGAYF